MSVEALRITPKQNRKKIPWIKIGSGFMFDQMRNPFQEQIDMFEAHIDMR
jgi:hypothetical protein